MQSLSRLRIKSASCLGMAAPRLDFFLWQRPPNRPTHVRWEVPQHLQAIPHPSDAPLSRVLHYGNSTMFRQGLSRGAPSNLFTTLAQVRGARMPVLDDPADIPFALCRAGPDRQGPCGAPREFVQQPAAQTPPLRRQPRAAWVGEDRSGETDQVEEAFTVHEH
jgi:hypothetical protein